MSKVPILNGFSALASRYSILVCDIWGVLHNGRSAFPGVVDCLSAYKKQGGFVLLLSNAPRPSPPIREQLQGLGVPPTAYDTIVTSGDLTRKLLQEKSAKAEYAIHHVGPDRDLTLFEGLNVWRTSLDACQAIVCTGPFDDTTEGPEHYQSYWAPALHNKTPFFCANPDLQVQRGDHLIYCAGALAQDYEAKGGDVVYLGKPHAPVYEFVAEHLQARIKNGADKSRWLAIGDGLNTDILGATRAGIDALLITGGIHEPLLASPSGEPDSTKIDDVLRSGQLRAVAAMRRLVW